MRLEAAGNACLVLAAAAVLSTFAPTAQAQVSIHPRSTTPASWERFAIRVVNGTDTATTGVRVDVPDAVTVLGVEPTAGWTTRRDAGSDSSPQFVEWSGGKLLRGEFLEFAFLGRVIGDARRTDLAGVSGDPHEGIGQCGPDAPSASDRGGSHAALGPGRDRHCRHGPGSRSDRADPRDRARSAFGVIGGMGEMGRIVGRSLPRDH